MDDFRTPGQLLSHLLEVNGWDQSVLAIVLGVDRSVVSKLISGARAVDAKTALALGEVFDEDPARFLSLQKHLDLERARIERVPDKGRADRATLFARLPIAEMIHRGWLDADSVRELPVVEAALAKFFGVDSVDKIEVLPHAAKKTETTEPATGIQIAWIRRVEQIARNMVVPRYSRTTAMKKLEELKLLLLSPEEARKVPQIMAEAGIRFVIVEALKGAKMDGVAFWLNSDAPVIGMSLRLDRIDNFWFVLRHEYEHILKRHGGSAYSFDADLQGERAGTSDAVSDEERAANAAAADFCVPGTFLHQFIARKAPIFPEKDVLGFARTLEIHPGLVVGQIHHRTGQYKLLRRHLVNIRSIVSQGAMVDGWGDVAPVATV